MGGAGHNADIRLKDAKGGLTMHLDGERGNIVAGGAGHDGDIMLHTADGTMRIELEAHHGVVRLFDGKGHLTVELNGAEGEVKIGGKAVKTADHVFAPNYRLAPLAEVDAAIAARGCLPGVPSAAEFATSGMGLAAMNALLLEKIEELTLHAIAQEKRIAALEARLGRTH